MMYSSGIPILYIIGFVFYLATYLINKFLLIFYYQKSRTLTRTIPIFTIQYLKYGMMLHVLTSIFILIEPSSFKTLHEGVVDQIFDINDSDFITQSEKSMSEDKKDWIYDRVKYFHQQLFFIILISAFIFWLAGYSILIVLQMIAQRMFDFCQKHFLIYMEKLKEWASKRAEEMKK